jgi:hypothetical protein
MIEMQPSSKDTSSDDSNLELLQVYIRWNRLWTNLITYALCKALTSISFAEGVPNFFGVKLFVQFTT